ncbi:MAG: hypothetical protein PHI16_01235 [Methanocellales archaeon]|nr:hypothetical protein [Methanocellales archaeon]
MPTVDVYASNNVSLPGAGDTYLEVHNRVDAWDIWDALAIQQYFDGSAYRITRGCLYFNLVGYVPEGASIISAKLRIKPWFLTFGAPYTRKDFDCIIQKDSDNIRPSEPPDLTDYNQAYYSGNYGSKNTADMVEETYAEIDITDLSLIVAGGITKFVLRSVYDINSVAPTGNNMEYVVFYPYDADSGNKPFLRIEYEVTTVTTQVATQIAYQCAMGNGTITSSTNATERGFEIVVDFSGTLNNYIEHRIAGFIGDVTFSSGNWVGTLTKTETEEGDFAEGAYELVLGYPSVLGNPSSVFSDKLFKCEDYTYRAYAVIDGETYYGEYVAFSTLCDSGGNTIPTDDISEGDPTVPIIPIEPEPEPELPPFELEEEELEPYPPWDWDLPDYGIPDYPVESFVGDFYYHKPYTKKDLDELRKKCIIYNKNSVEFALVLRHNMNVLREFFNMMTDYMEKDEYNDFTDLIPPQRLKELYLDDLEVNDFKDMINEFIRNNIDNNISVNRNFDLIQEGLSDYETESDDAYFSNISSTMKTVTENDPDVDTLKRVIDNLNQEVATNYSTIMHNLEILRARLL